MVLDDLIKFSQQKGVSLVLCDDKHSIISQYIVDVFLNMILRGVYSINHLPTNSFIKSFQDLLLFPTPNKIMNIKKELSQLYDKNIESFALQNIAKLIKRSLQPTTDLKATVCEYFIDVDLETLKKILQMIKGR